MGVALPRNAEQDQAWSTLMAAAQRGDAAAYRRLLQAIVPFLRLLARRQQINPANIDDVVQDVLLTLHRVRHTYDPARNFTPWLAAIAQRRAIDARRRLGRVAAWETADEDVLVTFADPGANAALEGPLEGQEQAQWLYQAMAELPEKQRRALQLVKLDQMSVAEAAAASGQSAAAIKVNTHRAIAALRTLLGSR